MKKIREIKIRDNNKAYIEKIIFAIQIIYLLYLNLTQLPKLIHYDSSCFLSQAVEMWRQKKIVPSNWAFQTSLYTDSPVPLASILYGITGNIFVSYGLSILLLIGVVLIVIRKIMNDLEIEEKYQYLAYIIVLTPYSINGEFGFYSLLYIGSAAYLIRILLLLLYVYIYLKLKNNKINKKSYYLLLTLCWGMSFVTGFSSGIYFAVCGIFPIIVYELIDLLLKEKWKIDYKSLLHIGIGFFCVILGSVIANKTMGNSYGNSMNLTGLDNFRDNFWNCIIGIFELFGGIPGTTDQNVLSLRGVSYLIRFMFVLGLFCLVVFCLRFLLHKKENKYRIFIGVSITYFFINLLVLILTYTKSGSAYFEYRYHIMTVYLLLISIPIILQILNNKLENKILLLKIVIELSVVLMLVTGIKEIGSINNSFKELKEVSSYIGQYDAKVIIVLGDSNGIEGRIIRVLDTEHTYHVTLDGKTPYNWGASTKYQENHEYAGPTIILTQESYFNLLPDALKDNYVKLESIYRYDIYYSKINLFDLVSGLPNRESMSRDYPYSPGYIFDGELSKEGLYAEGKGGYVIWGPFTQGIPGLYNIILKYEYLEHTENSKTTFDICANNGLNLKAMSEINENAQETILSNVNITEEDNNIELRVWLSENDKILIKEIEMVRIEN